jgi:hypothetical protein
MLAGSAPPWIGFCGLLIEMRERKRTGALESETLPFRACTSPKLKIAPETSAATGKLLRTVALKGAMRPKLMKTTVGQQISITRKGNETQFLDRPG